MGLFCGMLSLCGLVPLGFIGLQCNIFLLVLKLVLEIGSETEDNS